MSASELGVKGLGCWGDLEGSLYDSFQIFFARLPLWKHWKKYCLCVNLCPLVEHKVYGKQGNRTAGTLLAKIRSWQ